MAFGRFVFAALVAAAAFQAVAAYEEDEGVLVLDDSNFDDAVKEFAPLLVEFYAPWCGHCKSLAPQYAKAAKALKADGKRIAKVDATVAKDLATRFSIQGFPTLKFFPAAGASPVEYNGGREADSIVGWVRKKSGPVTKPVATVEEAKGFAAANEVAVIGFFAAGSAPEKSFSGVASSMDDVPFALTSSDEVRAEYGVAAGKDGIVIVNKFVGQANTVVYTGDIEDAGAVTAWVTTNSLPLVIAFTQENAPKIFRGPIKNHYLFFADPNAEGYEASVEEFRTVAKTVGDGKALFVTVDPSQDRVVSYFGVTAADMPTAVIVTMPEGEPMKKFIFPKAAGYPVNADNLSTFYKDYFAGKLKAFLKSEPVPADESTGPVTVIVGSRFEAIALDTTKDVLVEFYAPWCGHCKSLAPEYEKLGKNFASVSSIVIAKMDATANEVDHPSVNIKGFPTILFFPATEAGQAKKVVEYDGSRDIEGFTAFLKKNAVKPFTLAAASEDDEEL